MQRHPFALGFFLVTLFISITSWAGPIVVIVNQNNPVTSISDRDLADFFMKKNKFWSSGNPVVPIDQDEGQAPRELFLRKVIGKSNREMTMYWIESKTITGDSQPQTAPSDRMVIRFVAALPWAIGYVNKDALAGESAGTVKVIKTIDE